MDLTHFSLFTGIGGIDLAAEWAGFETVGQCEWADYQTKVLEKHWPGVPRWRDIRNVTADSFYQRTGLRTVKLISGGFPCQPFSVAGNQKGKEDERYLWPEMLRVAGELKPDWVLGENVPGILSIAADEVCQDLEREGYEVAIFNFEAAAIGAPHRRERVFFVGHLVANARHKQLQEWEKHKKRAARKTCNEFTPYGIPVPYPNSAGLQKWNEPGGVAEKGERINAWGELKRVHATAGWKQWEIEPDVGRVANGVPSRVDRLKCLGNAVVPQQVYPILKAIAEIEMAS